jgi:hypothetical protein
MDVPLATRENATHSCAIGVTPRGTDYYLSQEVTCSSAEGTPETGQPCIVSWRSIS